MGNAVKDALMYALADALNMSLEYRRAERQLRGEKEVSINLSGLKVPLRVKVVSSLLNSPMHMLMAKVTGNLALFLSASESRDGKPVVNVHILNRAKMGKIEDWLEINRPKSEKEARKLLGKAVVKVFSKIGNGAWVEIAA